MNNIDFVYSQYIRPLSYNEKVFIVQKILHDFIYEQKKEINNQIDKLKILHKFKGIAKNSKHVINDDDWYKQ
jgi:predicted hydrolase (HD superfamily)